MSNTIFVCVIISIFSGSLVLLAYYNSVINNRLYLKEDLINTNRSAIQYFSRNLNELKNNEPLTKSIFDDEVYSQITRKVWGLYNVLSVKTYLKRDTIVKSVLLGEYARMGDTPTLYVSDYDIPIKVSGKVSLNGKIAIPNSKYEYAFVSGDNKNRNNISISSKVINSNKQLPRIQRDIELNFEDFERFQITDSNNQKEFVNTFDNDTKLFDLTGRKKLEDIICKGNLILFSSTELTIGSSAELEDVIVIAPSIIIEEGFIGSAQFFAEKSVTMEEQSRLKYPSSIYIKNDIDSAVVTMAKNTKLLGTIILTGNSYKNSTKRIFTMTEDSKVVGNIYCYGKSQVQGDVYGNVYTDRLYMETGSSSYENMLYNVSISYKDLPKDFIEIPLFNSTDAYKIIKEY